VVLQKLARSGITIVLVTHHLPEIIPEIERVVLLRDGRLFRDGSTAQLLTSGTLSQLFGSAVEVLQRGGYYHLL
jgi:iron complex transport system ATP-binding protein